MVGHSSISSTNSGESGEMGRSRTSMAIWQAQGQLVLCMCSTPKTQINRTRKLIKLSWIGLGKYINENVHHINKKDCGGG